MSTEDLNTILYQKMYDEQEQFKEKLMSSSPRDVMLTAYELVIREDILLSLEYNDLSDAQAKALLKSEHPLSDLYLKWENHESRHMEEIQSLIEEHADQLIRSTKAKTQDAR